MFDIENKKDFIVLEVSSFQLELVYTFKPNVAVILNITPDHLDRYPSFRDYALSKFNIFNHADEKTVSLLNKNCHTCLEIISESQRYGDINYTYFAEDFAGLAGHLREGLKSIAIKEQNIIPAIYAIAAYIDIKKLPEILQAYKPLEHRIEPVTTHNGVEYYNDSKATNTQSVRYAVEAFDKPIHLILGGSDKGEDFSVLIDCMKKRVKRLYLIGETAEKMRDIFDGKFEISLFTKFEEAIHTAINNAQSGEVVLLSPACASFDWFKNYEERGKLFKEIVIQKVSKL